MSRSVQYANGPKNVLKLHIMQRRRSIPNGNSKTSSRCARSVDDAELGHFTLLFCIGRQRNTRISNACAQLLFCSLNLLLITRRTASYC